MISPQKLLKDLKINGQGEMLNERTYTLNINGSNEFGKISALLDQSSLLTKIDNSSYVSTSGASLDYNYKNQYALSLIADFEEDNYHLFIIKTKE